MVDSLFIFFIIFIIKSIMKKIREVLVPNQKIFTTKGEETSWSFLHDVEYKKYGKTVRRIIKVKCECGRIKDVQYNNIRGGHSKCCGFDPCRIPYNKHRRNPETTYNVIYYTYKKGALKRHLPFELSIDQFKTFLDKNCFYCDEVPSSVYEIRNSQTGRIRAGLPLTYNGIDRMDNNIGYTMDNSVTCCITCNRMKMALGYQDFLNHVEKIYKKMYK